MAQTPIHILTNFVAAETPWLSRVFSNHDNPQTCTYWLLRRLCISASLMDLSVQSLRAVEVMPRPDFPSALHWHRFGWQPGHHSHLPDLKALIPREVMTHINTTETLQLQTLSRFYGSPSSLVTRRYLTWGHDKFTAWCDGLHLMVQAMSCSASSALRWHTSPQPAVVATWGGMNVRQFIVINCSDSSLSPTMQNTAET